MYRLFQLRLLSLYYERYRRIWVQRSKYSIVLTLFPREGGQYQMVFQNGVFHGFGQEMEFHQLVDLINEYHGKERTEEVVV